MILQRSDFGKKNLLILTLVFALVALSTLALREIANRPNQYADFSLNEKMGETLFVVNEGDTGAIIGRNLQSAGVIKASETFFRLAVSDPRAKRISPGAYTLDKKIPAEEALKQLLDLKRVVGLISLRDGVRLSEVVSLMESNGYQGVRKSIAAMRPPKPFTLTSIEGFLYPAKYAFVPNTPTKKALNAMVERFSAAIAGLDLSSKFTPDQILIIASLIEAEGTPDVFPQVSRVIYNRLEKGIALQLDSTVHYIQGTRGDIALSLNETKINNRFNTYRYPGLPPGPIGSPTIAAIRAALNPEPGDWLYFITVAPKDTRFTNSYDQFLQWKELYRKNYREGLFND
jgi:UPF0755 protein